MRHLKKMPQETKLIIEMKYLFVSGIKAQILHRIIHSIIWNNGKNAVFLHY